MRKITKIAVTAIALTGAGGISLAQDASGVAKSVSKSAAASGSIAQGGNVTITNTAPDRVRQTVDYGTQRIESNAAVFAPALAAGVNPCAVSASIGGGWIGGGGSIGGAWSDKSCERRAESAMLAGMGRPDLAMRHLAKDPEVYQTLVEAGVINQVAAVASNELDAAGRRIDRPETSSVLGAGGTRNANAADPVCRRGATNRTVVTNWADQMACARSLGMAR